MENLSNIVSKIIKFKNGLLLSMGFVILLTSLVLSLQLIVPWRLIDDAENLRMGQEIDNHFSEGNYSWILSYEKDSGRFRPGYWFYHYLNYKIFGFNSFGHHLSHLSLYILITSLIFLITRKVSKSVFSGIIAVILFLFFYPISENLYRLGTAEPLLIFLYLLITLLLVNIFTSIIILKENVKVFEYLLLMITIFLAYFTKEVSPILPVAFLPIMILGLVHASGKGKREWIKFSLTFLIINILILILILEIKKYSGYEVKGSYTQNYNVVFLDTIKRFVIYFKIIIIDFNLIFIIPIITYIASLVKNVKKPKNIFENLISYEPWQLIFLVWFIIFLVVQSPWIYIMGRYLMPSIAWLVIFLGMEIGKYFNRRDFLWKSKSNSFIFKFPLISIGFVLLIVLFVYTNSFKLYGMYRFEIRDGRATQRVIKYLANNVPKNGYVYANFSDVIGEYIYEMPLHFRFFYSRPDISVEILDMERKKYYSNGDYYISYKQDLDKYKISDLQKKLINAQEIIPTEFWYDWRVFKL